MPYVPSQAPAHLDLDGLRSWTEDEFRRLAQAYATDIIGSGGLSRITPFETAPVLRVVLNTLQSVTNNVATKVAFDVVDFDSAAGWNATSKRYIATKAGYYQFNWNVYAGASTGLTRVLSVLFKNNAQFNVGADYTPGAGLGVTTGADLVFLNGTTDYVEMFAIVAATTPLIGNAGGRITAFSGSWVRP